MRENEMIKKGASELVLLCLLEERDMYGYELRQLIIERSDQLYSIPEGTMYIFLYRMSEQGYISERKELVGKRRTRVYYHLEPKGREYLEDLYAKFQSALKGLSLIYEKSYLKNKGESPDE